MSIQAIAWVLDHSDAFGVDRLVLIALANHANSETGECRPGYRRIAHEARVSTSTVGRAVRRLAALGEVVIVERGKGHGTTKYRLPWLSTSGPSVPLTGDTDPGLVSRNESLVSRSDPVVSRLGGTKPITSKQNRAKFDEMRAAIGRPR